MKTDPFLQAYIITALWSSTEYQFGECPCCGKQALLSHYPEPEFEQTPMCSAPGCGVREIPNPDPMDRHYSESDLAPEARQQMARDCEQFLVDWQGALDKAIATGEVKCGPDFGPQERAAHDFWLSRNGHGAGFFDGDWPEPYGDILQKASESFGDCDLYAGDDGKLYIS